MSEFEGEFLSEEEGSSRSAVKKLTKRLELDMMKLTVNAPDW
jgi:glycerol-3-phosphate O-acyltransferase/dihydroxyacetone phosphate acyltransferase